MDMRKRYLILAVVALVFVPSLAVGADDISGEYVVVTPLVGRAPKPIRKFLTTLELDTLERVDKSIQAIPLRDPEGDATIVWHVEEAVVRSPAFRLQRDVMRTLRMMFAGADGFSIGRRIDIIVAKTQSFIWESLKVVGCDPDLGAFDGQILMGAALCNRRVIVSNVTGYLFLTRPGQRVTSAMERRAEPPLSRLDYRLAARNSSALAHEWVHFFRMAGLGGRVPPDEPLWFAEGFAEFWAHMAKVRHYGNNDAMVSTHVIRLRDFFDWERQCPGPLRRYRIDQGNSCHYHLGMLAIEYLVANYGGLEATTELFRIDGEIPTFVEGFKRVFGIDLSDFEAEADRYIETIRKAELTK